PRTRRRSWRRRSAGTDPESRGRSGRAGERGLTRRDETGPCGRRHIGRESGIPSHAARPVRRKEPLMSRALSPLLSAVVLLASVPGSRAADEDPKAIVAKAIKAHGGEDDLAKYKAAQATNKGKITLPGVGEVEFTQNLSYMLPDKIKDVMELSVGGQKINVVTVANGDKISIEVNGKAIEVPDQAKEALKDARHMMKVARLVPLVREKGYELSL